MCVGDDAVAGGQAERIGAFPTKQSDPVVAGERNWASTVDGAMAFRRPVVRTRGPRHAPRAVCARGSPTSW